MVKNLNKNLQNSLLNYTDMLKLHDFASRMAIRRKQRSGLTEIR